MYGEEHYFIGGFYLLLLIFSYFFRLLLNTETFVHAVEVNLYLFKLKFYSSIYNG